MDIQSIYNIYIQHPQVITDSRKVQKGCLFFALRGDNFNGNLFAQQALDQGAEYAIVDQKDLGQDDRLIFVDNVLETLQQLATLHRSSFDIPVIALTGTNGKTTTKELSYSVLSQKYKTHATQGNLNNHIGVPLTLLAMPLDTEIALIEMGANHIAEIDFLCHIAQPTHGLITNVGKAHLEGFGSYEGVKNAKGELYRYLGAHRGQIFVQGDNTVLKEMLTREDAANNVVSTYGIGAYNNIIGAVKSVMPLLEIEFCRLKDDTTQELVTHLTGVYNLDNILSALCIGSFFGLTNQELKVGVESYIPVNQRSQVIQTVHNTIVADYYNANPSSMEVALQNIQAIEAPIKVVILGDMFELGDDSDLEHKYLVQKALDTKLQRLIFVGHAFKKQECVGAEFYSTTDEAQKALANHPVTGSTVLLKGSRGMAFERLMEVL